MKASKAIAAMAVGFVLATSAQAVNLLSNGDFEQGNTGFSSGHVYNPSDLYSAGTYSVTSDPKLLHDDPAVVSYNDHTTGSGKMMAINGAMTILSVWSETVMVLPNTAYDFTGWLSNWSIVPTGQLRLDINGTALGTFDAPSTSGIWQQFGASWNSGAYNTAVITLTNVRTDRIGNDYALDDLSFTPEPTSLALLAVGGFAMLRRRAR